MNGQQQCTEEPTQQKNKIKINNNTAAGPRTGKLMRANYSYVSIIFALQLPCTVYIEYVVHGLCIIHFAFGDGNSYVCMSRA
jgi:hypothetical protein